MTTPDPVRSKGGFDCTIVIPAYNAASYVEETVHSALAQDPEYPPVVIVVDDGSSDNTLELVQNIPGVTAVQQKNGGRAAACNTGLDMATTTFVMFLDSDDTLLPGALEAHLRAFGTHPHAVMVYGSNHVIDENGKRLESRQQPAFETRDIERIAASVTPCGSQVLYRRDAVNAAGKFDPTLRVSEDVDMSLRLPDLGSIVCHGEFVMNYRRHGAQLTKRPSRICRTHLKVIARALGPHGRHPDAGAQRRVNAKWKAFYGQNIPAETIRHAAAGRFGESLMAGTTFLKSLPYSGIGAMRMIARRISG